MTSQRRGHLRKDLKLRRETLSVVISTHLMSSLHQEMTSRLTTLQPRTLDLPVALIGNWLIRNKLISYFVKEYSSEYNDSTFKVEDTIVSRR